MSAPFILHGLKGKRDELEPNLSPHVWKTKLDLAYLEVPYSPLNHTFVEITGNLCEDYNVNKITVPTLKHDDGHVTDSWQIAEYLEKTYAVPGKSLFLGSPAGKDFCKFVETWANFQFASEIRPMIMPKVYERLDPESAEYFIRTKFQNNYDMMKMMTARLSDAAWIESQCATVRARLQLLESHLSWQSAQGKGLWIGGAPSHADFVIYGFYAWSRLNPDVLRGVWEHESLPCVRQWVGGFITSGLIKEEELLPL